MRERRPRGEEEGAGAVRAVGRGEGVGRPALHGAPAPPPQPLNKLFFLFKLRPTLLAAAAARRTGRPARPNAEPRSPAWSDRRSLGREPRPGPQPQPRESRRGWHRAVGAGGSEPCIGHGFGVRGAGPGGHGPWGGSGQPGPRLVPPRPEPRCRGGAAGPGRPRWQLPGPRQRERGGSLRALRPVSGAGAPGVRGHGPEILEQVEGLGQWDASAPKSGGLGFLLGLRKDAGGISFLSGGTFWGLRADYMGSASQGDCNAENCRESLSGALQAEGA